MIRVSARKSELQAKSRSYSRAAPQNPNRIAQKKEHNSGLGFFLWSRPLWFTAEPWVSFWGLIVLPNNFACSGTAEGLCSCFLSSSYMEGLLPALFREHSSPKGRRHNMSEPSITLKTVTSLNEEARLLNFHFS